MAESADDADGRRSGSVATAVVIVNYRTKELACDAVRSVAGEPGVGEIVVVDNASGDGSVDFLARELGDERVRIVESPANVGFGRGVNLGVEHCTAPLLLVLNSDATLLPGSLARLRDSLLREDSVAIVAPAVYRSGGRELQPGAYGVFPTLRTILLRSNTNPPETLSPDWVSGVAMLVRRSDFQAIGGFDAAFMMYLEDVDLCRRFRAAGKDIRRELTAGVVHIGAQSWSSPAAQLGPAGKGQVVNWAHQGRVLYSQRAGLSRVDQLAIQGIRLFHLVRQRLFEVFRPRLRSGREPPGDEKVRVREISKDDGKQA